MLNKPNFLCYFFEERSDERDRDTERFASTLRNREPKNLLVYVEKNTIMVIVDENDIRKIEFRLIDDRHNYEDRALFVWMGIDAVYAGTEIIEKYPQSAHLIITKNPHVFHTSRCFVNYEGIMGVYDYFLSSRKPHFWNTPDRHQYIRQVYGQVEGNRTLINEVMGIETTLEQKMQDLNLDHQHS